MTKKLSFEELKNGKMIHVRGSVDELNRARSAAHKFAKKNGLQIVTAKCSDGVLRIAPMEKSGQLPTPNEVRAFTREKKIARLLRVEEHRREKLRRKYGHG